MIKNKNEYLNAVLQSHKMGNVEELMTKSKVKRTEIKEALEEKYSEKMASSPINSGSYAKYTAINIKFDVDLCIPFQHNSFDTLEAMADDVYQFFKKEYEDDELIEIRKQRVSIGLTFDIDGDKIQMDVVPGRELTQDDYDNSNNLNLYVRKKGEKAATSTQTNIQKHIDLIKGKETERSIIKLLKIYKFHHNQKMKSFFMELLTINAFDDCTDLPSGLWEKLKMVIEYIIDNIETKKIKDPANSSNVVSDTLSDNKKKSIRIDFQNMLKRIDENVDELKHYFPMNEEFPIKYEETDNNNTYEKAKIAAPTILSPNTPRFG